MYSTPIDSCIFSDSMCMGNRILANIPLPTFQRFRLENSTRQLLIHSNVSIRNILNRIAFTATPSFTTFTAFALWHTLLYPVAHSCRYKPSPKLNLLVFTQLDLYLLTSGYGVARVISSWSVHPCDALGPLVLHTFFSGHSSRTECSRARNCFRSLLVRPSLARTARRPTPMVQPSSTKGTFTRSTVIQTSFRRV